MDGDVRTGENKMKIKEERMKALAMTLQEMRNALGDSRRAFSERYEIPLRTLEDWEAGRRKPAPYILKLLERAVLQDLEAKEAE